MKDNLPVINEVFLIEKIGPSPTVRQVADFLGESVPTTWRRLRNGELQRLDLVGNARVSLKSLADLLNKSVSYQLEHKRGVKPGSKRKPAAR